MDSLTNSARTRAEARMENLEMVELKHTAATAALDKELARLADARAVQRVGVMRVDRTSDWTGALTRSFAVVRNRKVVGEFGTLQLAGCAARHVLNTNAG